MSKTNKVFKFGVASLLVATSLMSMASAQGLSDVFPKNGLLGDSLNINSIVVTGFKLILAIAVIWVVYNIVVAGIKIAGAKDDADKRKNGLKSIVNAAIGLVVALSAFAIVNTVQNQITGRVDTNINLPCSYDIPNGGGVGTGITTNERGTRECKSTDGNFYPIRS